MEQEKYDKIWSDFVGDRIERLNGRFAVCELVSIINNARTTAKRLTTRANNLEVQGNTSSASNLRKRIVFWSTCAENSFKKLPSGHLLRPVKDVRTP